MKVCCNEHVEIYFACEECPLCTVLPIIKLMEQDFVILKKSGDEMFKHYKNLMDHLQNQIGILTVELLAFKTLIDLGGMTDGRPK